MFRDETVKVEKRVRASWGYHGQDQEITINSIDSNLRDIIDTIASDSGIVLTPYINRIALQIQRQFFAADLGVAFYVHHYILGYPDEVRTGEDLSSESWFHNPAPQATMAALGLAGLGNRNCDKRLQHLSRVKYGEALRCTNEVLSDPLKNLVAAIRATIMLALFQCVHMTHESHQNVKVHLLGCMALIKSAIPIRTVPAMGIRGLLQLYYSLLVPCISHGLDLPDKIFQWIADSTSSVFLPPDEKPGADLVHIIARFAQLIGTIRTTAYTDGRESTERTMRQLLSIDIEMEQWEASRQGPWLFQVHRHPALPPEAAFRNQYHCYSSMWTSRIWNHFRWARLLTCQETVEFVERYPTSATRVVSSSQLDKIHFNIHRLAVDVLTSSPTHYKHPRLTREHLDIIQTHGGAGAGAVGIPHLMFQLQVAACAPGVPYDVWRWALDTMETAWGDLGMLHVKSLAEVVKKHRARLDTPDAEVALKIEYDEDAQGGHV